MKLGNTGGRNLGKKYLKIKGNEPITQYNQHKADKFKDWFGKTYTRLQTELINKDTFNEDILNDTFLRIYDKIRFGGLEIANFKAYFHRAFFPNFMQETINQSQGITTSLDNHDIIDDTDNDADLIAIKANLESDIFHYVYQKYSLHEFELFKMYMSLKPAVNYATLAGMTKLKAHNIERTISKIKKDIRDNKDFAKRRQEITTNPS